MLKNVIKFEETIEGRQYQIVCDNDSPSAHAKEFAFLFLKLVGQIEDQAKAAQDKAKSEEVKQDSLKPSE